MRFAPCRRGRPTQFAAVEASSAKSPPRMLIARSVSAPLPLPELKLLLLRRASAAVSSVVSVTAVPLALKISRKEWRGVAWRVSRCVRRRSSKVAFARVTYAGPNRYKHDS